MAKILNSGYLSRSRVWVRSHLGEASPLEKRRLVSSQTAEPHREKAL
ncbi:MAG: hypothetical protein AAGF01_11160 [Cyanobacteria bacterium P01_G01_bin.38]